MARPTVMTENVATEICSELAAGRSLRSICAREDMPAISTVLLAVVQDRDGFRNSYAHAREAAGYAHGDFVVEVVDMVRRGEVDAQTAKAMMDGLKWAAERMAPKAHSQRQDIAHTSPDGSMTPRAGIDPAKLSTSALAEIMRAADESAED